MRINLVVNSFPNTSETFLFNLVVELEKRGHDVTICAFSKNSNTTIYRDRLHKWSGKIVYIPALRWFNAPIQIFTAFRHPKTFMDLLRKRGLFKGYADYLKFKAISFNQPEVIHFAFSGIAVNLLPILDLLGSDTKLFVSCRGTAEKVTPVLDPNRAQLLSQVFSKIHRVHCVSEDMKQSIMQYGLEANNAFVNYPSINTSEFVKKGEHIPKKRDETFRFITTGRLNYIKGYIYAIGAMANLVKKGYNIQYKIVGDGPDTDMLNYIIRERGLQHFVTLTGKVSLTEVNQLLQQADIFILPSLSEGISNAALEAMALEMPVVSTNAGGMSEAIQNGYNGLLVERFSEYALETALEYMIQHHAEALLMGKNGRTSVENTFTLENQINIFECEYQKQ
jgi:colanic acid/amylovoran biosynthesis glycosyltransferase